MQRIIPIKDLRNTTMISEECHKISAPIFITKNGYGDMVVMSIETYERDLALADVYKKVAIAEREIANGEVYDAEDALSELRAEYGY